MRRCQAVEDPRQRDDIEELRRQVELLHRMNATLDQLAASAKASVSAGWEIKFLNSTEAKS